MRKLSQREIGFLFVLLGIIITFLPIGKWISVYNSTIVSSAIGLFFFCVRIILLTIGFIKIFSKKEKIMVNKDGEFFVHQKIGYKWALFWIIIGILPLILFLLFLLISCETEECRWGSFLLGVLFGVPALTFGMISIAIGLVKLNKYLKYKKSQQIIPEENK